MIKQGQKVTPKMKAMCLSKTKHTSMLAAEHALDAMKRLPHSGQLNIYTCEFCGGLHIGKKSKKKKHEQTSNSNGDNNSGVDISNHSII